MTDQLEKEFLTRINEHAGIAHKVASVYFQDPQDREDIFQEMMVQLWRAYGSFEDRSKFSTWMYRVCLNTALTFRRKSSKQKIVQLSPFHEEKAVYMDGEKGEEIKYLYKAISTLTPLNKAIILLYLEDLSYDEISVITGLTKSNVGVRLVRIKKDLEEKINKTFKSPDNVNI